MSGVDIHEITEKMAKVDLNALHDVQFLVTCTMNEGDSEEARLRLRRRFLKFAENAGSYMICEDKESGVRFDDTVKVLSVTYQIEAGEERRRAHVHAVIVACGRGKVFFDLERVRADFPHMYWHFDYSRQPRQPQLALQDMLAYTSKCVGVKPLHHMPLEHCNLGDLQECQNVVYIGTASDMTRARRSLERSGCEGCIRYTELRDKDTLAELLERFPVWKRRPKSTARFVFVIVK